MKYFTMRMQSVFIGFLLLMFVAGSIYGQDYYDLAPVTQYLMQNLRTMQFIEAGRRKFLAKIGKERILAGKASTTFTNDPRFSLRRYLIEQINDPNNQDDARTKAETKQLVELQSENALHGFYTLMVQSGFKKNDFVDGVTMIFAHNCSSYIGKEIPKPFLAKQNSQIRQQLLKDEIFQGWTDKDRQTFIERNGALAFYALTLRKQSEQTNNPQIGLQSRKIAIDVFMSMFGKVPDRAILESIANGEKVNLDGKKPIAKVPDKNSNTFRLPGAKATYIYNNQMDVPSSLSANDSNHSPQELRQYLQYFYTEVAKRGGQKNDMAFVAALVVEADYYVLNDGKQLTPRQFTGAVKLLTDLILANESLQNATDMQKQLASEKTIIYAVFNFVIFQRAKASLIKGNPNEKYGNVEAINSSRVLAKSNLNLIFETLGEKWELYHLTPDGFVK